MSAQGAESMVLESGRSPLLIKGGEELTLSMPPLDRTMLSRILAEVAESEALQAVQRGERVTTQYAGAGGTTLGVAIKREAGGPRMVFGEDVAAPEPPAPVVPLTRPATPPAPAPAPSPSAAATAPSFPQPGDPTPATSRPRHPRPDPRAAGPLPGWIAAQAHQGATDIILSTGLEPRVRNGGRLRVGDLGPIEEDALLGLLATCLDDRSFEILDASGSVDLALSLGDDMRFRVALFRQHGGLAAAIRPVRTQVPTLHDLGLPADFTELVEHRTGLVLLTGATGSGKSSTLAALIGHLNQTAARHILTLEDPIEFVHGPTRSLVHQREVGRDVESFAAGLRAALRESPDVILVGEIRDHATASAAMTAAETGHLVLSTLHTRSADTAVERIVDLFPAHQQEQIRVQIAGVLRAVVAQQLLPGRQPGSLVPAYERLVVTTPVAAKIREGRGHQLRSEIQKGRADGMVSLEGSVAMLVHTGRIDRSTAETVCDPAELRAHLTRLG